MLQVATRPKEAPPPPTMEQEAIIDIIRKQDCNLQIEAFAGTGKTTMLEMVQSASKRQPCLYLAFGRTNKKEAEIRFPSSTTVRSFNGCGHRAWQAQVGTLKLDDKKTNALFKEATEGFKGDDRKELRDAYMDIVKGVSLAKSLGYIPGSKFPTAKRLITREAFHAQLETKPSHLEAEIIDDILFRSIQAAFARWVDFNDQVYMPSLFGGSFPRFPFVLVDEAQDLNPVNHEMLKRLVNGRLCSVGDRFQSIYAFRGAVQSGMDVIRTAHNCQEQTLSISFRCPKAIVEAARWRVPEFQWVKEGGAYDTLRTLSLPAIPEGAAILSRNNAPLFRLAFSLLSNKRSVQVAGSEIGPRLIRLLQKIGDDRDDSEALCAKIDAWLNAQLEKSNAPKSLHDMADCLKIFSTFGANLAQAVAYAEHLFKQQGTIKLSTIHKAKGLEWDTVYFLDRWLCGSDEQDLNVQYVGQTRAKQSCFEIDSKDIRGT